MSVKSAEKPFLGPFVDNVAELVGDRNSLVLQGPVSELVKRFGLGKLVDTALHELGCQTGHDLLRMNPDRAFLVAGKNTAKRIRLLYEFLKLESGTAQSSGHV